jgi:hypothetical protein
MGQNKLKPVFDPLLEEWVLRNDIEHGVTIRHDVHHNILVKSGFTRIQPNFELRDGFEIVVEDDAELRA